MTAEELDKCYLVMDKDGDGEVSFEEFEAWYNEVKVETMDADALSKALQVAGIAVMKGGASDVAKKEALKAHMSSSNSLSVREVFDRIDLDGGGSLDKSELEKASGMLGANLGL